jgi:hypothetical protein
MSNDKIIKDEATGKNVEGNDRVLIYDATSAFIRSDWGKQKSSVKILVSGTEFETETSQTIYERLILLSEDIRTVSASVHLKKLLVVRPQNLVTKTNWSAVNRQS